MWLASKCQDITPISLRTLHSSIVFERFTKRELYETETVIL